MSLKSRLLLAVSCLGLCTACGRKTEVTDRFEYQQLTHEGGETGSPRLSPDGKFVVYASDQGAAGNLDIWLRSVDPASTSPPTRLTDHPARDYDPVFSGDGQTVFFTSLREPQGIYRVKASGGDAEMVARGAVSPEVSPDGQSLLFSAATGQLALMRIADGSIRVLPENFANGYAPKWSPDGQEILFTGKAAQADALEWWIVGSGGGQPINTGILAALHQIGFIDAFAQAWLPGNEIVFAGKRGEKITLWRFHLPADRRGLATSPVRATDNDSGDFRASYGVNRLAFERTKGVLNLWSLPVDADEGRALGEPERLTSTDVQKGSASISADGKKLLYSADRGGTFRLMLKDLTTGKEGPVGPNENSFYGVMNAGGSRYFYGAGPQGSIDVSSRGASGWRSWFSRTVCEHCGIPRGIARDGNSLLLWTDTDPGNHIDVVDTSSHEVHRIVESSSYHFYGPELSPDGRWISLVAKVSEREFRTYLVPVKGVGSVPEIDWVQVGPQSDEYRMPFWAPGGNLLYVLNEHGEGNLTWLDAQRLDPETKRPVGDPSTTYRFKSPRIPSMDPTWNHPAAVQGRIILELADVSTNIWTMSARERQ